MSARAVVRQRRSRRSEMKSSQLSRSRFIVGIVLVVIAVLMFLFAQGDYSTAGAIGIGVLGLISIAISRRR
jgi:cell division protein FtsW (lipid II flippase)